MATVEQFKQAAVERNITRWNIGTCTFCGYATGYVIIGGDVVFDAGCHCRRQDPNPSSWEDLAYHYNRNQPDQNPAAEGKPWLAEMQAFWGFDQVVSGNASG